MSDYLMLHGVLNMPLPDNPAECDIVAWVQFKQRAREASTRIIELEAKLADGHPPKEQPTKDTVPWHVFSKEMQWAMVDCVGYAFVTSYKPTWHEESGYWYVNGPACPLIDIVGYQRGTCHPVDSIQRRPEGV